jgi:hypothetical protein
MLEIQRCRMPWQQLAGPDPTGGTLKFAARLDARPRVLIRIRTCVSHSTRGAFMDFKTNAIGRSAISR